jgi:ectoine hydroxylase-related dioxygenase (phytanoyl-CoA dioxygenase family)
MQTIQSVQPVQGDLQQEFYQNGYIILRGFFSQDEIKTLMADIHEAAAAGEKDFLSQGNMTFHSELYRRSEKLRSFLAQPKIVEMLRPIAGPGFWIRWDQAVAKEPGAGTFPWHQDNAYNNLSDIHYQLWIALTEMTEDNGGLWLKPGSHTQTYPHKWVKNHLVCQVTPEDPIFISAEPGDVVLFSSFILHSTTPNVTQDSTRWAYVVEYMSTKHYDPGIATPYFVVAQKGKPQPALVDSYAGSRSWRNQIAYGKMPMKAQIKGWIKKVAGKQ